MKQLTLRQVVSIEKPPQVWTPVGLLFRWAIYPEGGMSAEELAEREHRHEVNMAQNGNVND